MQNEQQTHSISKIHVKRCCPIGNKQRCTLWAVSDGDGYSLGKFGTKTGAIDFATGCANRRALHQFKASLESADVDYTVEIEE